MGISEQVHALALQADERMLGLRLAEIAVDGRITKAPSGGEKAGRSPVDRGKQGLKRSVASDATGVPLRIVAAGANQARLTAARPYPRRSTTRYRWDHRPTTRRLK